MKATLYPSLLKGSLRAPASKSSMQRALAAALIKGGKTIIQNTGDSEDDKAALSIIKALGTSVISYETDIEVTSYFLSDAADKLPLAINCGESGLAIRMFTPIVSLLDREILITGSGSLLNRPIGMFEKILPELGVEVKTNEGKLPLFVRGPLQPADIELDGSLSSQFLTGLLFAYAAAQANDVIIKVNDLKSKPYIDLTVAVMKSFGLPIPINKDYKEFIFQSNGKFPSTLVHYSVECDWSGGAFLLVAGAVSGPLMITGLDISSTQADRAILDALMSANAAMAIEAKGIKIRPAEMNAFEFDATESPDLFPPLVALAAYCRGTSFVKGARRLLHKESNRAQTLQQEFGKMGVIVELNDDIMIIHGNTAVKGAVVDSHHDHRIAMACAVAALQADGITMINNAEAVNKSYPRFFDDLKKLGADVSLKNKNYTNE